MVHILKMWRFMRRVLAREKIEAQSIELHEYIKINADPQFNQKQREIVIRERARLANIRGILEHKPIYIPLLMLIPDEQVNGEARRMVRSCRESGFLKYKTDSPHLVFMTDKGYQFAKSWIGPMNLFLEKYNAPVTFLLGFSPTIGIAIAWLMVHFWPIIEVHL